jgi:hypothetical protein
MNLRVVSSLEACDVSASIDSLWIGALARV